jgi:hypothetical protein
MDSRPSPVLTIMIRYTGYSTVVDPDSMALWIRTGNPEPREKEMKEKMHR